jgi:phenylpropionate dioxygenase-like ring-hydroxylating dioxygenase large terminal subunit
MAMTELRPGMVPTDELPDLVPRERYISRAFLDLEYEHLWPKVWQFACREEQVPEIGDFYDYAIGDQSVLVVRAPGGALKGYHNSCLHRGTKLKAGCGNAQELRCPYHAWRWALDGTIKEVVDCGDFRADLVTDEALRLPEVRVETWGGFVWINFDPDAQPLLDWLSPLPDVLAKYELEKMRMIAWRTAVVPANWKVAIEAFIEGYHVQGTHPQMLQYLDDTKYRYDPFPSGHSNYWVAFAETMGRPSPRLGELDVDPRELLLAQVDEFVAQGLFTDKDRDASQVVRDAEISPGEEYRLIAQMKRQAFATMGLDVSHLTDRDLVEGDNPHFFPNCGGVMTVSRGSMFRMRPNGNDPDSCIFESFRFKRFAEGEEVPTVPEEKIADYLTYEGWGPIMGQDMFNMDRIQRGLHSRGATNVILGQQELCVRNLHRTLSEYLGLPPSGLPPSGHGRMS